jgi:lysophospholipase L1-like esterase
MKVRESELRERLRGADDEDVYAALVQHFEPSFEDMPFVHRWCPRPELEVEVDDPTAEGTLGERLVALANYAQRSWRLHRFRRRRDETPELPVVVCEGDSWVAHPFITDITDHLLDDERYPLHALGVGAAADLLGHMDHARDHEQAIVQYGAAALVVSGGGNDLMDAFPHFLRPWIPGSDPERLLTAAVDTRMQALMGTMRQILTRMEGSVPVVVHGYDYLRVRQSGEGGRLGPSFDHAGIADHRERTAVLWAVVDRYNAHLRDTTRDMPWVTYVDLRGTVIDDEEWHDDIHPNDDGFGRLAERIAEAVLERLGDAAG